VTHKSGSVRGAGAQAPVPTRPVSSSIGSNLEDDCGLAVLDSSVVTSARGDEKSGRVQSSESECNADAP